jgi:hypothetical protein
MPLEKAMNGLVVGEAAAHTAVVSITDDPAASAQSPGHDSPASACGPESSGRKGLAPAAVDVAAVAAPAQCTALDGVALGHRLMDAANKSDRASAIIQFVLVTALLNTCVLVPLDGMLVAWIAEAGIDVLAQDVRTADPAALTTVEAATIGRGCAAILRISATPDEAVDESLSKYPALRATAQQHVWFRPMLVTVAKRCRAAASPGMRLRLGLGAGFSIMDMLSDMANIVQMFLNGQSVGACALLSLIVTNLAVQLLLVVLQNSHRDKREVAWEIFLVLSLVKAGVDAMRVARGEEHVSGAPFDPFTEMVVGKLIELIFESIPGAVVQAIFLLSGGWTTAAVVSIAISCLSTAFAATMLAYDMDTNAAKRRNSPEFYGCVPNRVH